MNFIGRALSVSSGATYRIQAIMVSVCSSWQWQNFNDVTHETSMSLSVTLKVHLISYSSRTAEHIADDLGVDLHTSYSLTGSRERRCR